MDASKVVSYEIYAAAAAMKTFHKMKCFHQFSALWWCQPSELQEVALPVIGRNAGVLNGVAAVQHGMISYINADVRRAGGVVRFLKEDQIAGFCVCRRYIRADLSDALGAESAEAPANAAVVVDVADEAGAVEGGGRTAAAPE